MYKKWLIVKVFTVQSLQWLHILPKVWYQCELDLAKIRGKEWSAYFKRLIKEEEELGAKR